MNLAGGDKNPNTILIEYFFDLARSWSDHSWKNEENEER